MTAQEQEWFCRECAAHKSGMLLVAGGILKNEADVQDAVQDALIAAYENLAQLKNRDKFRPWLYRILTNACFARLRYRRREVALDEETLPPAAAPDSPDPEERLTVWNTVQQMPPDYRTVVILFYYEDMPIREIAAALGLSRDTVKKRLQRAREQLRVLLEKEGFR